MFSQGEFENVTKIVLCHLLLYIEGRSLGTLNESDQMLLLTPTNPLNPRKIAYSKTEDRMLDFEGNFSEKKDRGRIMVLDIGSSAKIEREAVASELEITMIDKFYHQEHSGFNSVVERRVDLLFRDSTISNYNVSI